jgi:hypothetical protein
MILNRELLFLLHPRELGKRVLVKCHWCDNIFEEHEGKSMSSKPCYAWEKFLVCEECYAPVQAVLDR